MIVKKNSEKPLIYFTKHTTFNCLKYWGSGLVFCITHLFCNPTDCVKNTGRHSFFHFIEKFPYTKTSKDVFNLLPMNISKID